MKSILLVFLSVFSISSLADSRDFQVTGSGIVHIYEPMTSRSACVQAYQLGNSEVAKQCASIEGTITSAEYQVNLWAGSQCEIFVTGTCTNQLGINNSSSSRLSANQDVGILGVGEEAFSKYPTKKAACDAGYDLAKVDGETNCRSIGGTPSSKGTYLLEFDTGEGENSFCTVESRSGCSVDLSHE